MFTAYDEMYGSRDLVRMRLALREERVFITSSQGGGMKDTWVLET